MEQNPIIQINNSNSEEHHGKVALPYNQEQFQAFIIGLLGKPQVVEKNLRGSFEVDMEFISNLIQIIEQRIHQQNDARLLQLRSTIVYNDGTSVSLSGFEHLINYNEPLPLYCKALHLTLQYLVLFKDKESAEKQEISISFQTTGAATVDDFGPRYYSSHINFRIAHTARTFGADLESLLTRHLSPKVIKNKIMDNIHSMDNSMVQNIFRFLIYSITLICSYYWLDFHKVYLLIYLFVIVTTFTYIIDVLIEYVIPEEHPSFILITRESHNQKLKDLKKYRKEWLKFILSTIGGLILGLLGNFLYAYLTKL